MLDDHEGRRGPLRSLGEVSHEVVAAMRDHSFWGQRNRTSLQRNAPVPTESQVRALLDAAFFASMLEEEGRRVTFTLAFVSPRSIPESWDLEAVVFAKPIELHPRSVAKLAPSALPDVTYIGVAPNDLGDLEIWGLVHRGDRTFGIDLDFPPSFLQVRVHRAGTISARYISNLLFLYTKGAIHFLNVPKDLLGQLRDRFGLEPVVAQVICRLSLRVLEHGHGGALLVVAHGSAPARLSYHPSYRPHDGPSQLLKLAVEEYEADNGASPPPGLGSQHQRYGTERRYSDALTFIARLTAVDGATVLDDRLYLLGFGAIVQTSDAPESIVVQVEDVYTGETSTTAVGDYPGTRHRSAIQFCASQPDGSLALAMVASQDGQLSVFAKAREKDTVIALRSFELGIGI
jgi:hypothetical protein